MKQLLNSAAITGLFFTFQPVVAETGSPTGPPTARAVIPLEKSVEVIKPEFRKPVSKSRILSLYHQLKSGMTKNEVEKILGQPVIGNDVVNGSLHWYIKETERRTFAGSPWGYAGIRVFYNSDDRLVNAQYNFQYVKDKHIERYTKKYGKPAK